MGNPNHVNSDVGYVDMDYLDRIINGRVDIGADEINCQQITHDWDWNNDGLINLHEFNRFSRAWLATDPNQVAASGCDLNTDGVVNLTDLHMFCDNNSQVWLWTACYLTDVWQAQMQMRTLPSGGEEMQTALTDEPQMIAEEPIFVAQQPVVEEKSIEEQILDTQNAIEFLETLWLEEPDIQQEIDAQSWQNFIDAVYQSLSELETQTVQN